MVFQGNFDFSHLIQYYTWRNSIVMHHYSIFNNSLNFSTFVHVWQMQTVCEANYHVWLHSIPSFAILIRLVAGIDCGPHGRQGSAESITHLPPSSIVRAQQAQQCTYNVFFLYPKEHQNIFLRLKLYRGFILHYLKLSRVFQN